MTTSGRRLADFTIHAVKMSWKIKRIRIYLVPPLGFQKNSREMFVMLDYSIVTINSKRHANFGACCRCNKMSIFYMTDALQNYVMKLLHIHNTVTQ